MLSSGASLGINTPQQYITQRQNEKILSQKAGELGRFGQNPGKVNSYPDESYASAVRGLICEKGHETNPQRILIFQFNPETITDVKSNNFNVKPYSGFTFNDNIWASGGERIISFKLNFEATAAFNTPFYGKGSSYGNAQVDTLETAFPRGTLDLVELLQSYQYPTQQDPNAPRFANGGFIPAPKFMPPPTVIFAYGGNYYLEGTIGEVTIVHTLVNKKLIPIRSEADVTFKVSEQQQIKVKNILASNNFSGDGTQVLGSPNVNTTNGSETA